MIARLLGAVRFLTIFPVSGETALPGESAIFFPLVGAALGAAGGYVLELTRGYLPFALVSLLVLMLWVLVTGGLHEDGLADVADAVRAWRSPEKILAILKDSRIGSHGALALLFVTLIRWQALSSIAADPAPALAAIFALSRTAMIALVWTTQPVGSGAGMAFSSTLTTPLAVIAILEGIAIAFWPGMPLTSILTGAVAFVVVVARRWFLLRIGGVTGDCLGATQQVAETVGLIILTCRPCIS